MGQYLAFDIGGTTIKYGVVHGDQTITDRGVLPTQHNADGAILKALKSITMQVLTTQAIDGIGVSTAGIVGRDGAIQYAGPTIPGYQGTPIKSALADLSHMPVAVVNDVDAALLGEQAGGAAQGRDDVYCVALGTGIGGAYYRHGQLISGAHGTGNSVGYLNYDVSSATNYEQRAATLSLEAQLKSQGVSVIEAFEQAKAGHEPYTAIITAWAQTVATGLAPIVLLLDPEVVVIGGAVSKQGQYLLDLLNPALDQLLPVGLRQTELRVAALGNDAQLVGAVAPFLTAITKKMKMKRLHLAFSMLYCST